VSGPTCWQTSIYKSTKTLLKDFLDELVVSLSLKFCAGGNVITVSFIGNNSEHVVALKVKSAIIFSSCHKLSNMEDAFYDTSFLYTVKIHHEFKDGRQR